MTRSARTRVLHSIAAPGKDTRYATHMAAVDGPEFEMVFFSWRRALLGHYDILHVHWPEQLVGQERGLSGAVRWLRVRALLARLRRRDIPVVRTLHNLRPHDRVGSSRYDRLTAELDARTRVEIHLVPEPGREVAAHTVEVPHGDYRAPYARHPRSPAQAGRLVSFGILKRYKGIDGMLDVFAELDDDALTLRVVGEPVDAATVAAIDAACSSDRRVSRRYGFVPDADLVREVSAAQLVVLPYAQLHSSGALLAALSLNRPVLVPDTSTTRALRDEVGTGWVRLFAPPITAEALRDSLRDGVPAGAPDLRRRAWDRVREGHERAYRLALPR